MKRIRIVGLCIVAVFAFSAVAAATASAAPEIQNEKCVKAAKVEKKYTGSFNDKACTEANEAGEGRYTLEPVAEGTPFTSKSKAATFKVAGKVVTCKKDKDAGEYISGGFSFVTITFEGCYANGNKHETCQSGAEAGTITTNPLVGILVYINEVETEHGIVLVPAESGWASFKCGSETEATELEGGVLGTVTNTSKGETLTFSVNGGGEQAQRFYYAGETEGPINLTAGSEEATLVDVDAQGPKGVGAF
ncbi:MAG TPA: hypothetical protein VMG80_01165 [Solirubrobacteraceae bacterium]|nr:hypothetical protein [Solirubrobacteraceae bacterium]